MSTTATRRRFLAGLATAAAAPALAHPAFGQEPIDPASFRLYPNSTESQTGAFSAACAAAAAAGLPLFLPAGIYIIGYAELPAGLLLQGVPGATILQFDSIGGALRAGGQSNITLDGLVLDGAFTVQATAGGNLRLEDCDGILVSRCIIRDGRANGISIERSAVRIEGCDIFGCDEAAVFALDSRGISVSSCRISGCGNGGVLVWRSDNGRDGSIISGNSISTINNRSGGSGQYGNGINVFRADEVIVSGNHIADVQFSAIRLNSTNNTQVSGNTCLNSGEVAIFSEFAFSGSIIADNIVDGAAQGISITNFNEGGRLATCTGNIVRNITPTSPVNPDTDPVGIFAEADAVISGNVVEAVPGLGIGAGWGPYLRDVVVTDNVVRDVEIGIGVSVADGAGTALVSGNLVSGARKAEIAGLAWEEMVSDSLERDAARFPNVTVTGNALS